MKLIRNLIAAASLFSALLSIAALVLVLFGYRPFILKTQSMEPVYQRGSLCWIDTATRLDNLHVGDALVYRSAANSLVLHRLMDIKSSEDLTITASMKGDANDMTQEIVLSRINYIGREVFTIPRLGAFVDFLVTSHFLWFLIGILVILACIPWHRKAKEVSP